MPQRGLMRPLLLLISLPVVFTGIQQSALLYIEKQGFCCSVQHVLKSSKIIFRSNPLVFEQVRAGWRKILKLFLKNELDVSWRL